MLYIIPFLHQTTTMCASKTESMQLYIIPFLHQTTTLAPYHAIFQHYIEEIASVISAKGGSDKNILPKKSTKESSIAGSTYHITKIE